MVNLTLWMVTSERRNNNETVVTKRPSESARARTNSIRLDLCSPWRERTWCNANEKREDPRASLEQTNRRLVRFPGEPVTGENAWWTW